MTELSESDKSLVSNVESDKERNFAQLRASKEQLAKEKAELAAEKARLERENAELRERNASSPDSRFLQEAGVDPDATWMETKHLPGIVSAMEKRMMEKAEAQLASKFKQYEAANVPTRMMADTGGDYLRTVNEENVKKAVEQNPHLMMAFEALSSDPIKHAQFAYQACKQIQDAERRAAEIKKQAEQASRGSPGMPPVEFYGYDYSPPKADLFKRGDMSVLDKINRVPDEWT